MSVILIRLAGMLVACGSVRSKSAATMLLAMLLEMSAAILGWWGVLWVARQFTPAATGEAGDAIGPISNPPMTLPVGLLETSLAVAALLTLPVSAASGERSRVWPLVILCGVIAAASAGVMLLVPDRSESLFRWSALLLGCGAALGYSQALKPRSGKFNRDGSMSFLPGHALPLMLVGATLVIGLGLVVFDSAVTVAAALLGSALFGQVRFGKVDPISVVHASFAVSVFLLTSGTVGPIIGLIVGVLSPWAVLKVESRLRIDDPSGLAVAILVGLVAAELIAAVDIFTGQFASQFWWVPVVTLAMPAGGYVLARVLARQLDGLGLKLRVSEEEEFEGLDLTQLDLNAYPDFQQTIIRSHHLRQS